MKYLIDTHTLLWFLSDDAKLPTTVKTLIENPQNVCLVHHISLWEIAIKVSLNKLPLFISLADFFKATENQGFTIVDTQNSHLLKVATLPFYHKDPFDRLLISYALTENIPIVSVDEHFSQYGVEMIWN
jgi:PIN domain nuclease of toxin-antitoxin system